MPKSKLFSGTVLLAAMVVATSGAVARPTPMVTPDDGKVVQLSHPYSHSSDQPRRDDDDFMTFRWMVSADGGESWSAMMGAGNTGMLEVNRDGDTVSAWGAASYDFGAVVDGDNHLHFAAVLDAFGVGDLNPLNRRNGVYDVRCSPDGAQVSYNLIAEEAAGMDFTWSDCGINAAGDIYVLWVNIANDAAEFLVSKSTDDGANWSQPFRIASGIDVTGGQISVLPYPHMTPHVDDDFFYVIYQTPGAAGWDHHVLKVPAALEGNVETMHPGATSAIYFSYYVPAVNAIDMDPATGDVYFAVVNPGANGVTIGNLTGGNWAPNAIAGVGRYPGVGLDFANQAPWVSSNYRPPAPNSYQRNWFGYDEIGYNGNTWLGPFNLDSLLYDGVRSILYVHQMVWTSTGRQISGANVWGQLTPEGFQVNYSDNGGVSWHGPQQLWSIFDAEDALSGGFIAQNILLAGADNHVFVALCGKFGATDFQGPDIAEATLSSYMLGQPWNVTCELFDENGIEGTTINYWWTGYPADSLVVADPVSGGDPEDQGNGMYTYSMGSDSLKGHAIANGDSIWFYIDAWDPLQNYTAALANLIIVGREYQGVQQRVEIPQKTELGQNYPNPFNNSTSIPFALDRAQQIKLQVWDVSGRLVATLYNGRMTAGRHQLAWMSQDVSSGVYVYTLQTAKERFIGKMSLLH